MRISDWSSDVCSSDLVGSAKRISVLVIGPCVRSIRPPPRAVWRGGTGLAAGSAAVAIGVGVSVKQHTPRLRGRSEERRVWNECVSPCRSRWLPAHLHTKTLREQPCRTQTLSQNVRNIQKNDT